MLHHQLNVKALKFFNRLGWKKWIYGHEDILKWSFVKLITFFTLYNSNNVTTRWFRHVGISRPNGEAQQTHTSIPSNTCAITTKFNSDVFTIRICQLDGYNCKLQLLNYIYFNTLWFPRCPLDMTQGIRIRPQLFYQMWLGKWSDIRVSSW